MALWFWRGLRRGIVTTAYPCGTLEPWTRALPSPPLFDATQLDTDVADRLVAICPSSALRRNDHVLVYDVGACTACGRCLIVAPAAMRPSGALELAATARHQLVKEIPLRKAPVSKGLSWPTR